MKKRTLLLIVLAAILSLSCIGFAACTQKTTYTVTYYDMDQKTVLKTEKVAEGEKAQEWTPEEKADADFLGWYATPDYVFEFDFDAAITQDTPVYSMWSTAEEDTRTWMIAGNFQGEDLKNNNWGEDGRLNADKYDFEPVEGEFNTFTLTVDLYEGDVFQFGVFRYDEKPGGVYERAWEHQKGFGLLEEPGDNFTDEGNYLMTSALRSAVHTSSRCRRTSTTITLEPLPGNAFPTPPNSKRSLRRRSTVLLTAM